MFFRFLTLLIFIIELSKAEITDLKPISQMAVVQNHTESLLLYREFKEDGKRKFLASSPLSLKTFILNEVDIIKINNKEDFKGSNLDNLLKSKKPIKSLNVANGYFLTIDLCAKPLNKNRQFERELFEALVSSGKNPTIGIAISGVWIKVEKQNFIQLIKWRRENKLDIIWINHSANHQINDGEFLTQNGVDFTREVLEAESILLSASEVPSIFFRFPGLISNHQLLDALSELSLISLDANAWIGKGEKLKSGSIILVHGNGNEVKNIIPNLVLQIKKDELRLVSPFD
jgi:hypothetical protein